MLKNYNIFHKKTSDKKFGLFFSFVFFIISVYMCLKQNNFIIFFIISFTFFYISFVSPRILKILNLGWQKLGLFIGKLTNPIIMFFLFVVGVGSVSFIKVFLKKRNSRKSSWNYRNYKYEKMSNQF